eukprot:gene17325-23520_t
MIRRSWKLAAVAAAALLGPVSVQAQSTLKVAPETLSR